LTSSVRFIKDSSTLLSQSKPYFHELYYVGVFGFDALPPGNTRYPLYRRLGGPQDRSGRVRKISPPPRFDPRTVQPVVIRYTDWATRPTNSDNNKNKILLLKILSALKHHIDKSTCEDGTNQIYTESSSSTDIWNIPKLIMAESHSSSLERTLLCKSTKCKRNWDKINVNIHESETVVQD
jgi:hypothetical protein